MKESLTDRIRQVYLNERNEPTPKQVSDRIQASSFRKLEPHYQPTDKDIEKKYNARKIRDNHEGKTSPGNK